uniref:Uncharacterized protein n=1 Tax=Physcomitrium patens TaxID=3218 RepID=A0A2K1JZ22_PHYPA|nr:hypothetical protein PHYPA_013894 [Physcomitrium patens]
MLTLHNLVGFRTGRVKVLVMPLIKFLFTIVSDLHSHTIHALCLFSFIVSSNKIFKF